MRGFWSRLAAIALVATVVTAVSAAAASASPQHASHWTPSVLPQYLNWVDIDPTLTQDANGVAMVPYGGSLGTQYNPTMVAQQAAGYYGRWLRTQSSEDLRLFFVQADWLVATQTTDGRWLYTFPWGDQPVPWWSGMAEGQAMSILIRAYELTGYPEYSAAVARARSTFERVISSSGVASWLTLNGKQYVVYEEALGTYCPRVLNGWIFALVGIYEDWIYLGDPMARFDFFNADRGVAALKALLPYYDTGNWTLYNLNSLTGTDRGYTASQDYEIVHVVELRYLARVLNDSTLSYWGERMAKYLRARGVQI